MKAKTVLILLSAVILCLTGCTESQKPTTVVDNSSAVTISSSADSESGNDECYDSTPISQAYLSGNTANLDDKQLEIYNKAVSAIEKLITLDMNDYEKELAVHCNFVIDKSVHTRMKFLAIEKNMSLRDIVNEAMKEYLEKNGK